jgi:hypothetical protein
MRHAPALLAAIERYIAIVPNIRFTRRGIVECNGNLGWVVVGPERAVPSTDGALTLVQSLSRWWESKAYRTAVAVCSQGGGFGLSHVIVEGCCQNLSLRDHVL